MDTDKEFDVFKDDVPYVPIDRLRIMQARARNLSQLHYPMRWRPLRALIRLECWRDQEIPYLD